MTAFAARRNAGKCDLCGNDIKVGEMIVVNSANQPQHSPRCPK